MLASLLCVMLLLAERSLHLLLLPESPSRRSMQVHTAQVPSMDGLLSTIAIMYATVHACEKAHM